MRGRGPLCHKWKLELVDDALHHGIVCDQSDDVHFALALGTDQGVDFIIEPEILLMDEPCSALDPIATSKIEDLMNELKKRYTIVIVTHNMQQAARVSDKTV